MHGLRKTQHHINYTQYELEQAALSLLAFRFFFKSAQYDISSCSNRLESHRELLAVLVLSYGTAVSLGRLHDALCAPLAQLAYFQLQRSKSHSIVHISGVLKPDLIIHDTLQNSTYTINSQAIPFATEHVTLQLYFIYILSFKTVWNQLIYILFFFLFTIYIIECFLSLYLSTQSF